MTRRDLRVVVRGVVALGSVIFIVLVALDPEARPAAGAGYSGGGGGGYSGGGGGGYSGGGSSSGGGDGAGLILYLLLRLVIAYPAFGVPALLIGLVFLYLRMNHANSVRQDAWSSAGPHDAPFTPRRYTDLAVLRARDPEFSVVLFEDFMYALYARVQTARGDRAAMAALAPYVAEATRAALLAREPSGVPIEGVIVGAMRVCSVHNPDDDARNVRVELEFEANYSARIAGEARGHYIVERWVVERAANVRSKPPTGVYDFRCPSCGAPFEGTADGRCRFCNNEVDAGRFDWTLTRVNLVRQETRPPALTADVAEQGTDSPTVFDPNVQRHHAALIADDPGAAPERIEQRLRAIYRELNAAWTARDLKRARPYVSDALFNYLAYWITAYQQQGLRNVLEDMEISRLQFVKVTRDRHYDAITLRFWATGRDYTVRVGDGERVSGSKSRPRAYSEYWTLIRGATVRGAPRAPGDCPGCGAPPARVSKAGNCEYCGAHLTRGEFDWVLSKIEQDDSYAG